MNAAKSIVFWVHLTLGVGAGLVILILSLSGMLLGYERQMIAWIDGGPTVVPTPGAARLSLDALLERAAIDRADVASLALRSDPSVPVIVRFPDPRRRPVMLNPFTGAGIDPPANTPARRTFAWIRQWHLFLGSPEGPLRTAAGAVSGAAMLALVLLVPLGIYLWWPSTWTKASLGATVMFRRGLTGRARDFNWHTTAGVWSALPLFLVALTAVFLSYQWPGVWLDRVLGAPAPASAPKPVVGMPFVKEAAASPSTLFASAERLRPAWQTMTMTLATARGPSVQVAIAEGNTFRPDLRTTVVLDPVSAAPVRVTTYSSLSLSRRLLAWVRNSHTGEAFGVAGQTVATAASAGGVLLAWTGLALAWRRFSRWRARRRA